MAKGHRHQKRTARVEKYEQWIDRHEARIARQFEAEARQKLEAKKKLESLRPKE